VLVAGVKHVASRLVTELRRRPRYAREREQARAHSRRAILAEDELLRADKRVGTDPLGSETKDGSLVLRGKGCDEAAVNDVSWTTLTDGENDLRGDRSENKR